MAEAQQGPASKHGAAYFDQWYADMGSSVVRDAIVARMLGLPPELQSTSLLTWEGIAEVTEQLRMPAGGLLVDLACGRGGYGIDVARRTGAELLGVDFSAVALKQAAASGARLLPAGRARFEPGTLTATGLPGAAANGVMCVDAVQFAEPPLAALVECRRILAVGGRLVLTGWEAVDASDEQVPPRLRAVNVLRDLRLAGFVDVQVQDRPDWRAAERRMWEAAVEAPADSDPAVRSLQTEGRRSLDAFDTLRRVFASATAP